MAKIKYLVGGLNDSDPALLRIIVSETEEQALMEYRRNVYPKDEGLLEWAADNSVNLSLAEEFWFVTPEEIDAFVTSGEVLASETQFSERVLSAFGNEHRELAQSYIQYCLNKSASNNNLSLTELVEFLATSQITDDWCTLFAVPLKDITVINIGENHE